MISKNLYFLLIAYFFIIFIISTNSLIINEKENIINKETPLINDQPFTLYNNDIFLRKTSTVCASTSYSKSEIQDECNDGPSTYDRILKYNYFSSYISSHDYHSNGLNYVTSLLVDEDTHHFGNFMNDGVGMIILYIIDGLMLLGWIPLLCCWRKRCCLFDDCLYENDCCIIFWHILTYFLAAAILSFLIVVLCFGE